LNQAEVADAQSWLSLLVRTLMVQLAYDVSVRAVEMPRARPCGLGSRLRPRRDCASFTDPMAVAIREAGRIPTRVAKPLAIPQEAIPKWFLLGFVSLGKMLFRKHGHVGVQIENKLRSALVHQQGIQCQLWIAGCTASFAGST
jgi:hypothetical protein